MQQCDFSTYISAIDALKKGGAIRASNFFLDAKETEALFDNDTCMALANEDSIFLLKPWHENAYDLFYLARDAEALENNIEFLPANMGLRVSVIGKDPLVGQIAQVFTKAGFQLRKKLLRMRCKPIKESMQKALRMFAEPYANSFDFAEPGEAEEILEILLKDFDLVGDNIPQLHEIRQAAANRQIPVLRIEGRIACFHYFTISQNILNGLYDVTRKEYRGTAALFPALKYYVDQYLPKIHPNIKRAYGWRDEKNKKLVKNAGTLNQKYDGVVIHNMFREAVTP